MKQEIIIVAAAMAKQAQKIANLYAVNEQFTIKQTLRSENKTNE